MSVQRTQPEKVVRLPSVRAEGPADNVLAYVHMLSNRIDRAFYPEIEAKYGVTNHEWRVMMTLAEYEGATASDIANRWGMEKMAASRAIRRLEKDGYVNRLRNPEDRRSFSLALSDEGRALYRAIEPAATARYRAIIAGLPREDLKKLKAGLAALIDQAASLQEQVNGSE